jgi:hypothetical protein
VADADDMCPPTLSWLAGYEHYRGMLNVHFDCHSLVSAVRGWFTLEEAHDIRHPVYTDRKLWEVVVRKA